MKPKGIRYRWEGAEVAPHQVVLFLQLVSDARNNRRLVLVGNRAKNAQTLASLGLKASDVLDAVAGLKPEQAMGLPRPNRSLRFQHEQVCEFGHDFGDTEMYVKVAAGVSQGASAGCVISFHPAEDPIKYPFKEI